MSAVCGRLRYVPQPSLRFRQRHRRGTCQIAIVLRTTIATTQADTPQYRYANTPHRTCILRLLLIVESLTTQSERSPNRDCSAKRIDNGTSQKVIATQNNRSPKKNIRSDTITNATTNNKNTLQNYRIGPNILLIRCCASESERAGF